MTCSGALGRLEMNIGTTIVGRTWLYALPAGQTQGSAPRKSCQTASGPCSQGYSSSSNAYIMPMAATTIVNCATELEACVSLCSSGIKSDPAM